jgi:hypothetical protein
MLPKEAITEYKVIYQKLYGVLLSDEEATLRANNLVDLYKTVYGQGTFPIVEEKENEQENILP